jgi:hypothetical protein
LCARWRRIRAALKIGGVLLVLNVWATVDGLTLAFYHGLERDPAGLHAAGGVDRAVRHHTVVARTADDDLGDRRAGPSVP